ncbi:MAG: hypothetical protein CSA75_00645 [Sorangium cellulosum]|nr:MAG: hypothetical protein CSA75_00645 [Sorangium cellulosum]
METQGMSSRWLAVVISAMVVSLSSCGPSTAKAPNPTRPIDEGRAVKLIAQVLSTDRLDALPPRMITLSGGTKVRLDVGVKGRNLGFIYLTSSDVLELGDDPLAKRPTTGDALIVRRGKGEDANLHVVVLYASDYLYDDNVGSHHEATAITAENKLNRDARDFLVIAQKNHWP